MNHDPLLRVKCPTCGRINFQHRPHCMACLHPFGPAADDANEMERSRGAAVSLRTDEPYVKIVRGPWIDEKNHEQAVRVNGCLPCPRCELLWPFFEEVDAWTWDEKFGIWRATEWDMGTAYCPNCEKVFVDTFEGCFELRF